MDNALLASLAAERHARTSGAGADSKAVQSEVKRDADSKAVVKSEAVAACGKGKVVISISDDDDDDDVMLIDDDKQAFKKALAANLDIAERSNSDEGSSSSGVSSSRAQRPRGKSPKKDSSASIRNSGSAGFSSLAGRKASKQDQKAPQKEGMGAGKQGALQAEGARTKKFAWVAYQALKKFRAKCFKEHPDHLVTSACLASDSFEGGEPLQLPKQTILQGLLTQPQLESVYKCTAQHANFDPRRKDMPRPGFFIADAVGVGKGRQAAGVFAASTGLCVCVCARARTHTHTHSLSLTHTHTLKHKHKCVRGRSRVRVSLRRYLLLREHVQRERTPTFACRACD